MVKIGHFAYKYLLDKMSVDQMTIYLIYYSIMVHMGPVGF